MSYSINMIKEITNEQNMIIALSRVTCTVKNKEEIIQLMKQKLNWFKILEYAIRHKVAPLMYKNLRDIELLKEIPYEIGRLLNTYYYATKERNIYLGEETKKFIKLCEESNVKCSILKGAYLIPCVYKDMGIRTTHDIDCLVSKSDKKIVTKIMNSMGYYQGEFSDDRKTFTPIDRKIEILWNMRMHNFYPYMKKVDSPFVDLAVFDISFALDFKLKTDLVTDMLNNLVYNPECNMYMLNKIHFFIHLCNHLYKEATTTMYILENNDLNLIKFCDVREYILQKMDEDSLNEAIVFAKKNEIEKCLYFCLYFLKVIYNDGYEDGLIEKIGDLDKKVLNEFGEDEYNNPQIYVKTFWERFFSFDNSDEIKEKSNFIRNRAEINKENNSVM